MIYPKPAPINWPQLVGGDEDATGAIAARNRKLSAAAALMAKVRPMAERLETQNATFQCSPAVLASEPYAARWYLDLAGLTSKLLSKLRPSITAAGLVVGPETIAVNLERGRPAVRADQLKPFSQWINELLVELYPLGARSAELAYFTAVTMAGARIDGQVRNMAGDDAVLILKELLVGAFSTRGVLIEVQKAGVSWEEYGPSTILMEQQWLRFGGRIVCEFVAGGNRPDIKVTVDGVTICIGEVKGRTDLSNVWESWMPQINGHLQTWTAENSRAPRLFFGTIITQQMIDGVTPGRTRHTGLRAFSENGLLTAAYNLTTTVEGRPASVAAFVNFVDELCRNL